MGSRQKPSPEEEADLVESTASEVEQGFLVGPFTEAQMDENCGHQKWLTTPRFVLYQGPSRKVRIIDDAKASALNAASR